MFFNIDLSFYAAWWTIWKQYPSIILKWRLDKAFRVHGPDDKEAQENMVGCIDELQWMSTTVITWTLPLTIRTINRKVTAVIDLMIITIRIKMVMRMTMIMPMLRMVMKMMSRMMIQIKVIIRLTIMMMLIISLGRKHKLANKLSLGDSYLCHYITVYWEDFLGGIGLVT